MKKLTKDQKHYRKKKKDGLKDFRQEIKDDGSKRVRVTRKTINVSISSDASSKNGLKTTKVDPKMDVHF